jgi:D-serine deaminase-like pyridoxal phosphate-dependent protein
MKSSGPIALDQPVELQDLPTPALVIDIEAMEHNLAKMARLYTNGTKSLRPHVKTHKCPILAKRQIELGAVGICAAKVSEAEVMVNAGIENVLITSPIVTREKIERLIALGGQSPGVAIVVDQQQNVIDLNDAAATAGVRLTVLVDLNVGTDRTGVAMGPEAVKLAQAVVRSPALKFGGLQAYAGRAQHVPGWENRRHVSLGIMERAVAVRRQLEAQGIEVPVLSGGGTGTYDIDIDLDGLTDLQAGSYLFMDVNYRRVGGRAGTVFEEFKPALLVLATAISQPARGMITVDAGFKAFATDAEEPEPLDRSGIRYSWAGDEHGILHFMEPGKKVSIGDKVLLIASHCDPTVNLYDHYFPMRNGQINEIWLITARGCSQ